MTTEIPDLPETYEIPEFYKMMGRIAELQRELLKAKSEAKEEKRRYRAERALLRRKRGYFYSTSTNQIIDIEKVIDTVAYYVKYDGTLKVEVHLDKHPQGGRILTGQDAANFLAFNGMPVPDKDAETSWRMV
jgi:hypothetical protein